MLREMRNFQGSSSEQGEDFRQQCVAALRHNGFSDIHTEVRFADVGIQIDIVATNKQGISLAIECKGSYQGDRPGSMRTDSVLKAIGEALLFSQSEGRDLFPPLILMTSHIADEKSARLQLGGAPTSIIADVFGPFHHKRLAWWAKATEEDILNHLSRYERVEELLRNTW